MPQARLTPGDDDVIRAWDSQIPEAERRVRSAANISPRSAAVVPLPEWSSISPLEAGDGRHVDCIARTAEPRDPVFRGRAGALGDRLRRFAPSGSRRTWRGGQLFR